MASTRVAASIKILLGTLLLVASAEGFGLFSMNIANYNDHPDWPDRLILIADAIASTKPDLIAFQEPRFDPDYPTTQTLYQNAGEQVLYNLNQRGLYLNARIVTQPVMYYPIVNTAEPNSPEPADPSSLTSAESPCEYPLPAKYNPLNQSLYWEGLTIISSAGIIETGTRFLTKTEQCTDANLRATQYIMATINGSTIYLFNTHFGLDNTCQVDNTKETITYMQNLGTSTDIKILVGDLNAVPTASAPILLAKSGLVDVWPSVNPTLPGYTHPSNAPSSRIDYVWVTPSTASRVQLINVTCTQPNAQGVYASDHLGLFTVFA